MIFDRCRQEVHGNRGEVSFVRWYLLRTPWLTICLHRFLRDDDWPPHNHEYDSASFMLWGGYDELIALQGRIIPSFILYRRRWLRLYWRTAYDFHRITLPAAAQGKVWTLFFQFNRRSPHFRTGYLVAGQFVAQADYDTARGRGSDVLTFKGHIFPKVHHAMVSGRRPSAAHPQGQHAQEEASVV